MQQEFPAELLVLAPDQNSCICADCLTRFQKQTKPVQQFKPN